MAFDRRVILALRDPANPGEPWGPPWLQEAARDVTSLGSIVVLTIMTLAVVGYLLLSRERAEALLTAIAVFGGMALNELLKLAFARPRPDSVFHAARVFTASFPSGHASLSAIAYLTIGALLARSQPSFKVGLYVMSLAAFLTVLIGMSRIYLGVHYPPTFSEAGASARLGPSRAGRSRRGSSRIFETRVHPQWPLPSRKGG